MSHNRQHRQRDTEIKYIISEVSIKEFKYSSSILYLYFAKPFDTLDFIDIRHLTNPGV